MGSGELQLWLRVRCLAAYQAPTPVTWHSGTTAKITRRAKLEKPLGGVQLDLNAFAFMTHKFLGVLRFFYI